MRSLIASFLVLLFASGCATSPSQLRGGIEGSDVVKVARKQIGTPYHFGGGNPDEGFDCSGLVRYSFGKLGVTVPHSTSKLYSEGHKVAKGKLQPGDLVFFNITGHGVSHVGIYSGGDKMVHAPSSGEKVREDKISIKYWLQRYAGARRLD